jgi:hypothetical protein
MEEKFEYQRRLRSENRQMIAILRRALEVVDKDPEYIFYRGSNGTLRWLVNYLYKTHPGLDNLSFVEAPEPEPPRIITAIPLLGPGMLGEMPIRS